MDHKDHKDQPGNQNQDPVMEEQPQFGREEERQAAEEAAAFQAPAEADESIALKQDLEEMRDKYLRLLAEFDNYKKRTIREKIDMMSTAAQDTMAALLPVLDDFDRAKKTADELGGAEPFSEGVRLVYNKLYNVLRQRGLEAMESTGELFDPELHEAVTEISAASDEMKGRVVDTIEKGYKLKDKIIRHAKVVVGK